jgi:UDP:flavonoid glycosyltransferase YjiC (YdhE family)
VYIGFGSMSNRKPEEMAELVILALKQINQRAVLLSGWGGLKKSDLPDSIYMIDSIPHSWLFQHVAVVVHHGGASTTAAGLRAGVPSVIVPFFGDQPFWARRLAELGVGTEPIPRAKLTASRLAGAIQQALTDSGMQVRSASLGAKIRAEDGIAGATDVIKRFEKRGKPQDAV